MFYLSLKTSVALFLVELRWPAAHSLFFSAFLLFYILNLWTWQLILTKRFRQHGYRNNFRFPLIDSLVVSALQEAGGYAISRQNNLDRVAFGLPYLLIELFYISMPVVRTNGPSGGRSVGVRSRDYQIFSDG